MTSPSRTRTAFPAVPLCRWCAGADVEFGWYPSALLEVADALPASARLAAACRGTGDRPLLVRVADALDRYRGPSTAPGAVLDVGAGFGGPAAWLRRERGLATFGVEPSQDAVAAARGLFPWVPMVRGDAQRLPVADGAFEAALVLGVVSLVDDVRRALLEARRAVRAGGVLALTDYVGLDVPARSAGRDPWSGGHPLLPPGTKVRLLRDVLATVEATGWVVAESVVGPFEPDEPWVTEREDVDRVVESHVARTPHGLGAACRRALRAERRARARFAEAVDGGFVTRLALVARAV
ncbi:MAG: class I SAM-dependent methyltransferase [Actinobacteria bacterium]|nr:class I SAM-dependent methyltransferase [Actinomycetota bacterium]